MEYKTVKKHSYKCAASKSPRCRCDCYGKLHDTQSKLGEWGFETSGKLLRKLLR